MEYELHPLKETLTKIMECPCDCWVYLPEDEKWSLESRSAILKSEEIPPELEDDPAAGIPVFALRNKLMQALPVSSVQDIVRNAILQRNNASVEDLFEAFLYYYDNDAFINLKKKV